MTGSGKLLGEQVVALAAVAPGRHPQPAYRKRHDHCAERHHDAFGEHIVEVKPVCAPAGGILNSEQLARSGKPCAICGATAETVKCGGHAEDENEDCKYESGGSSLGSLALCDVGVDLGGGDRLKQGHGGGDCCDENEEVEQEAHEVTDEAAHVVEYHLHGSEEEAGAAGGVAIKECVASGHNDHTCHDSNEGVHDNDDNCVLLDAFLLAQVGAVGDDCAHAEGQGEEHLTCCGLENSEEVILQRINVETEHELVAAHCAGLNSNVNNDDDEHDEEAGHTDVAELLDTAADTAADDDGVDRNKDNGPDDHLSAVKQEGAEEGGDIFNAPDVDAEHCEEVAASVAHDHAAEDHVEAEDQERAENCHVAEPGELLADLAVCRNGAHAGAAADRQLTDHNCKTYECCENEVDEQECKSAV